MKTRFFFLLKLFFFIGISVSYGETTDNNKTDSIVESLKNNKSPSTQNISDATSISLQLLERAKNITDRELRCKIGQQVALLEMDNRNHPHPHYRGRSNYFELRDELVAELEMGKGANSEISDRILDLFHPKDLIDVSQRIRAVVHRSPQFMTHSLMVLYANLPDNNKKEELVFVESILSVQATNRHDALFCQALQARFGDKKSEQALVDFVSNFWKAKWDEKRESDVLKDVLVCAGTEKIMQKVALGLQSVKQIMVTEDVSVSEASISQNVLKEKYQDDPSFPLPKTYRYSYSDQEIGELKKWCEKNLKVKYPEPTPTPKSTATPIIIEGGPHR